MALSATTIEKTIEGAYQTVLFLDHIQSIPLPGDVDEALAAEWALEIGIMGLSKADIYDVELRNKDRQRCISLRRALAIVDALEDDLLRSEIVSTGALITGRVNAVRGVIDYLLSNSGPIWDAIFRLVKELAATLWNVLSWENIFDSIWGALRRFKFEFIAIMISLLAGVISIWFAAINVKGVSANLLGIIRLAKGATFTARKAALKQSSGSRRYRRKVARL